MARGSDTLRVSAGHCDQATGIAVGAVVASFGLSECQFGGTSREQAKVSYVVARK
jgi:hypothetical protein